MIHLRKLLLLGVLGVGFGCLATTSTLAADAETSRPIRNVILMIGDGMGPQQMGLLLSYAHNANGPQVVERMPALERMMNQGTVAMVRTDPYGALVVDSASAATQLATGQRAGSEMIGINHLGDRAPTVLEIAKQQGKATGLVSDTRITHATPAAFAAHQRHRSMENEIAVDMLENQVDVMLSAGLRHWVPELVNNRESAAYVALMQMIGGAYEVSSKRKDNRNLLVEARRDYQLAFDRQALEKIEAGKVLGMFGNSEMNDALQERQAIASGQRTQPTLAEMAHKAIEVLDQDPEGFFLMIEGGQIDWAGHNNDAGTMLHEMLRFDLAVRAVLDWAATRDDTIVLVTADHETGGFAYSYSGVGLPEPTQLAGNAFADHPFEPNFNFGRQELVDRLFQQQKSYYQLFSEFDALPTAEQTAENLMQLVNDSMAFKITLDDAVAVLTRTRNRMYVEGHPYLGTQTVPRIRDFREFYVYGENGRMNVLARTLADKQNIVWASGTHTNTPVMLISYGPEQARKRFAGLLHATDIGQQMIHLVRGN